MASMVIALALTLLLQASQASSLKPQLPADVIVTGMGLNPTAIKWTFTGLGGPSAAVLLHAYDADASPPAAPTPTPTPVKDYDSRSCPGLVAAVAKLRLIAMRGVHYGDAPPPREGEIVKAAMGEPGARFEVVDFGHGDLDHWVVATRRIVKACPPASP